MPHKTEQSLIQLVSTTITASDFAHAKELISYYPHLLSEDGLNKLVKAINQVADEEFRTQLYFILGNHNERQRVIKVFKKKLDEALNIGSENQIENIKKTGLELLTSDDIATVVLRHFDKQLAKKKEKNLYRLNRNFPEIVGAKVKEYNLARLKNSVTLAANYGFDRLVMVSIPQLLVELKREACPLSLSDINEVITQLFIEQFSKEQFQQTDFLKKYFPRVYHALDMDKLEAQSQTPVGSDLQTIAQNIKDAKLQQAMNRLLDELQKPDLKAVNDIMKNDKAQIDFSQQDSKYPSGDTLPVLKSIRDGQQILETASNKGIVADTTNENNNQAEEIQHTMIGDEARVEQFRVEKKDSLSEISPHKDKELPTPLTGSVDLTVNTQGVVVSCEGDTGECEGDTSKCESDTSGCGVDNDKHVVSTQTGTHSLKSLDKDDNPEDHGIYKIDGSPNYQNATPTEIKKQLIAQIIGWLFAFGVTAAAIVLVAVTALKPLLVMNAFNTMMAFLHIGWIATASSIFPIALVIAGTMVGTLFLGATIYSVVKLFQKSWEAHKQSAETWHLVLSHALKVTLIVTAVLAAGVALITWVTPSLTILALTSVGLGFPAAIAAFPLGLVCATSVLAMGAILSGFIYGGMKAAMCLSYHFEDKRQDEISAKYKTNQAAYAGFFKLQVDKYENADIILDERFQYCTLFGIQATPTILTDETFNEKHIVTLGIKEHGFQYSSGMNLSENELDSLNAILNPTLD